MKNFFLRFKSLFDKQDFTTGSPTKKILFFFIPIILANLFQQLYYFTDALIVGQVLPDHAVAAINASSSINYIIMNLGLGCASGFSVIMAKRVGAKDVLGSKKSFLTQLILTVIVSIAVTVIGISLLRPFLSLMGLAPNDSDYLMNIEYLEAREYLLYMFGGAIAVIFYNLMFANLRAKGDSFSPFCFLAVGVIANIGLDLLFVKVLGMGVGGSALATILCQFIASIICFFYARHRYEEFRVSFKEIRLERKEMFLHLKNGLPLGFQFAILGFGILAMTASVVKLDINIDGSLVTGLPAQVGYGAANKLINLLITPLASLGVAMLSYIGQNYGAKDYERIKKGIVSGVFIGVVFTIILNIIGWLMMINGFYQYVFLSSDKVNEGTLFFGNTYLYISLPSLLFLMLLFIFRNVSQAMERPLIPFLGGVMELFARVFMVLILPLLIYSSLSSETDVSAYYLIASGDAFSWLLGALILLIPSLVLVYRLLKNKRKI